MRAYIILLLGLGLMGCNKTAYYTHEYTEFGPYDIKEYYTYTTVELDWKTPTTGVAKIRLFLGVDVLLFEDDNPEKSYLYFETRFRTTSDGRGGKRLIMKQPEFVYVLSQRLFDLVCDTRTYDKNNYDFYMYLDDDNKLKGFRSYLSEISLLMRNSDCLGATDIIYDKNCITYGMNDFIIYMDDDLHKVDSIDYTKFEMERMGKTFTDELKGVKLPSYLESIDDVGYLIMDEQVFHDDCR